MFSQLLLTAAEVVEDYPIEDIVVVENEASGFMWNSPTTIKFIILFAILITIGAVIVFHPTDQNKKDAKQFLEKMISTIYSIVLANIEYITTDGADGANKLDFNEFKKQVIDMIYGDAWAFVETSVDKAVTDGKLDYLAKKLIKKENVNKLVDLIVKRRDVNNLLTEAFEQVSNAMFQTMVSNDKKAAEEAAAFEKEEIPEGYGEPDMELINKVDKEQSDNSGIVEAFASPEDTVPTTDIDEVVEDDRPVVEDGNIVIMEDGQG